jgi:foldase protein PrsA
MKIKYLLTFLALVIAISAFVDFNRDASAANKSALIAPIVVEVNDEPIYETQLLYFLIGRNGQDILGELIENAILAQKAKEFGVTIDPNLPRDEMMKAYGQEKFDELSKAFKIDKILNAVKRERLAGKVYDALLVKVIKDNKLVVSQDEALDYYLKNVEQWSRPPMVRFSIIFTTDKQKADSALAELKGGADFAKVAEKYSEDKATAGKGGDIGDMIPEGFFRGPLKAIEELVFNSPLNVHSEIVQIENNYFIVMPTNRLPKVEKKFNEVKSYVEQKLIADKADPFMKEALSKYRDDALIEVIYPVFDTTNKESANFKKVTTLPATTEKCLIYPQVVKVNGEEINEDEMLFFLIGRYGHDILQELIENLAISQQADSIGVDKTGLDPSEVLKKTYSDDKLVTLENSFDMDQVRAAIMRELVARKTILSKKEAIKTEAKISTTESEAKKYFDKNQEKWQIPERVRFSIIVTEKEPAMKSAVSEIASGKSFEDTAKKYSIDELTKYDGGDIGTLWPRGLFVGPFTALEDTIFALEPGKMSDTMFIQDRFYLVKLSEKLPREEKTFEDVRAEIIATMDNVKIYPILQEWLTEIGDKAKINIKYPIFDVDSELSIKAAEELGIGNE